MFQICLEILILAMLAAVLLGKGKRVSQKDETVINTFEKIIEETQAISREFEDNLAKRQNLIQQISSRLDEQIREAGEVRGQLEKAARLHAESLDRGPGDCRESSRSQYADQQRILSWARKGLDASEIAKNLRKPVGEVELILNLRKIAS